MREAVVDQVAHPLEEANSGRREAAEGLKKERHYRVPLGDGIDIVGGLRRDVRPSPLDGVKIAVGRYAVSDAAEDLVGSSFVCSTKGDARALGTDVQSESEGSR